MSMYEKKRNSSQAAAVIDRPLRLIGHGAWMQRAACREEDPALFYDSDHETREHRAKREEIAMGVCWSCPVRRQCLTTAIRNEEPYGIWGGYTAAERWQLARAARNGEATA